MPPDNPVRRADTIPLEELASHANEEGLVKVRPCQHCVDHVNDSGSANYWPRHMQFCRCWKSKTVSCLAASRIAYEVERLHPSIPYERAAHCLRDS